MGLGVLKKEQVFKNDYLEPAKYFSEAVGASNL